MNAAEILRELVAIASPSAVSNLALLEWVTRFVKARGWTIELLPYVDENGVSKANLLARPPGAQSDGEIGLAFICHTDTVPFAAGWEDALRLRVSNDGLRLHGCGACDVKGALACFVAAVDGLAKGHTRPDAALILTADEEIGCKGMERLLAAKALHIRSAIVSEPTSLRPGIAGKGYGLARVTIHGVEAHSAFPAEGVSAIALASRFIAGIEELATSHGADGDALFDPPHTTVNVGVIQGGSAKNIVAGECSFLVEWRPIPSDAPRRVFGELELRAEEMQRTEPRARIEVESLRAEGGFKTGTAGKLRERIAQIAASTGGSGRSATGISFGSEASRIARVADEVIVIGPGDMHTAHSDRECVAVAELGESTGMLLELLTRI